MNQNAEPAGAPGRLLARFGRDRREARFRAALFGGAFAACAMGFAAFGSLSGGLSLEGIEAGKVADRDVSADKDVVYVDEQATGLRAEAERRLVPAVFVVDDAVTRSAMADFARFRRDFSEADSGGVGAGDLALLLGSKWPEPGLAELARRAAEYPAPDSAFSQAALVLESLLREGVVAMPDAGLEGYNPETVEIRRWESGPLVYEQIPLDRVVTQRTLAKAAAAKARNLKLSPTLSSLAADLAAAFARDNAFFDAAQSKRRLEAAEARVEPVMRRIAAGERVIRKGFIVTGEDMVRLAALKGLGARFDLLHALGGLALLAALFLGGSLVLERAPRDLPVDRPGFAFLVASAAAYFLLASALGAFLPDSASALMAALMPTALASILVAMLYGERFAVLYTLSLSLSLLAASGMDAFAFAQALASGIGGVVLARKAEKRIDLVRAGAQLAAAQLVLGMALGAFAGAGALGAALSGFWSGLNGFFCGVLALGFLPLLEQALNAPTVFRLQELSDLNAPALKRLLSVAPGTYSHSVTVAHLAESACREIGADALVARVGAYYHDIGKIEQPEYFIENQSGYNKHDEINPRLSATVLRSHVKFGLERADTLRLPESVREIIAQHHGTSLISYFYAQAQKDDDEASTDDYRYPGPVPSSREAAVVMLADCVEAASRTLKRPNLSRLEQFVADLIEARRAEGQLSGSALTFRDLETIQNTFVRILAGHFHSRIEYPKSREERR